MVIAMICSDDWLLITTISIIMMVITLTVMIMMMIVVTLTLIGTLGNHDGNTLINVT